MQRYPGESTGREGQPITFCFSSYLGLNSQKRRIIWVGRDLWRPWSPTPCQSWCPIIGCRGKHTDRLLNVKERDRTDRKKNLIAGTICLQWQRQRCTNCSITVNGIWVWDSLAGKRPVCLFTHFQWTKLPAWNRIRANQAVWHCVYIKHRNSNDRVSLVPYQWQIHDEKWQTTWAIFLTPNSTKRRLFLILSFPIWHLQIVV